MTPRNNPPMTKVEAKELALQQLGSLAFVSSYRGGHLGYEPRPMVYRIGVKIPGTQPKYLGIGDSWEEALDAATKAVMNLPKMSKDRAASLNNIIMY